MAKPDDDVPQGSADLLIADLEHFGESLWRNEEVGEKRFNFFITLVTAVIAGLVAFHTSDAQLDPPTMKAVTNGALIALLVLGLLTYMRMLQRNRVTDQYQRTLKYIRQKLADLNHLPEYKVPQPLDTGIRKWFRGGLAETVGAIDSVLLCTLLIINAVNVWLAGAVGLLSLAIFWGLAAPRKGVQ